MGHYLVNIRVASGFRPENSPSEPTSGHEIKLTLKRSEIFNRTLLTCKAVQETFYYGPSSRNFKIHFAINLANVGKNVPIPHSYINYYSN